MHHVTYVRIYETTREVVKIGYTPGYTGTVVTPEGVVVRGTGYVYPPWIGSAYYPSPATYGVAADARDVYAHWGNAVYAGARAFRNGVRSAAVEGPASGGDNDHYAESNGRVFRSHGIGWEKLGARGWERAAAEACAWANSEQEARASGTERFERQRAKVVADPFAAGRLGE